MRRLGRVVFWLFLGTLALMISGYVWLFHFNGLEYVVNSQIEKLLGAQYNFEASVGEIEGDLISGLTLSDVRLTYNDGSTSFPMLVIPRLSTSYSLTNLFESDYHFEYLHLVDVELIMRRDSSGVWLLPGPAGASDSGSGKSQPLPQFRVDRLLIDNASIGVYQSGDSILFDSLYLSMAVTTSAETYSVDLDRLQFISSDERITLDGAAGKLTYANKTLMFRDLAVFTRNTRIKLEGGVNFDEIITGRLDYAIDNIDLGQISTFIGTRLKGILDLNGEVSFVGKELRGSADIGGTFMMASFENLFVEFGVRDKVLTLDTLYGVILSDCGIDGKGMVDFSVKPELYNLSASVRNFNLREILPRTYDSDLTGRFELQGRSFWKTELRLDLDVDLWESSFDDYPIQRGIGQIVVTGDSISFADSFMVAYYENVFHASGKIDYDSTMYLEIEADLGNLDRYREKLFIDQPGGRGYARATLYGASNDPNLKGWFASDSLWLYGLYCDTGFVEGAIDRFLNGKKGNVELHLGAGSAWGLPLDSSCGYLTIDSNLVILDSISMHNQFSIVFSYGVFDYQAGPMALTLDTLYLSLFDRKFYNRSGIKIAIDTNGFDFTHVAIGNEDSDVDFSGRVNFDEALELDISVDNLPIAPWLSLFELEWPVDGRISSETILNGKLDQPSIELSLSIDSLTYRDLVLGNLTTGAIYNNRLLIIDSLVIMSDPGVYRADGFLHMDLALTTDSLDRFPDLPMDIHITADDRRFDLVSVVMPSVDWIEGYMHADFGLSGTPHSPELEGIAYIRGDTVISEDDREGKCSDAACLKYGDIEDPIYTDSAGVTMRNNLIILDDIHVYTADRKKGRGNPCKYALDLKQGNAVKSYPTADISGEITVRSLEDLDYDIDVDIFHGWPFTYTMDEISGRAEGEIHIEGMNPPLVSGDLTLISMMYLVNFAGEDEGSPIMMALSGDNMWDLDLNIDILSNYWIKNDDIDAEFGGQLNLKRDAGEYTFFGEMEIMRGNAYMADKTFRIEPDSRVIFGGEENLNGTLDITACTYITGSLSSITDGEDDTPERLKVCVHVTGNIDAPDISPTADSDIQLTKEELIPLLLANYYGKDDMTTDGRLEERLSGMIGSQLSQIGSKQLSRLGVETFEIDPYYQGQFDPLETRVTVGFYTGSNVYLYGRSSLSLQTGRQAGVEYRLSRNVMIDGRWIEEEQRLYRLGVKFHWEF